MLAFVSGENDKHRAYFKDLFDRTVWIIGVPFLFISVVVGYLGFNTLQGAKATARDTANVAVKNEIENLRPEMRTQIEKQFEKPNIEGLVREEAQRATETTANKIIKQEVDRQISLAIASEQVDIHRSLVLAADGAVEAVKGDIQHEADKAVSKIVDARVEPELRKLEAFTNETSLAALAEGGDFQALDELIRLESDQTQPLAVRKAASLDREMVKERTSILTERVPCPSSTPSESELRADIASSNSARQISAMACLQPNSIVNKYPLQGVPVPSYRISSAAQAQISMLYPFLDQLFVVMTTAKDLSVRVVAFEIFKDLVNVGRVSAPGSALNPPPFPVLDNTAASIWWKQNRRQYIH